MWTLCWMLMVVMVVVCELGKEGRERGKGLPVDVFSVGAEIGCRVDFVLEELGSEGH